MAKKDVKKEEKEIKDKKESIDEVTEEVEAKESEGSVGENPTGNTEETPEVAKTSEDDKTSEESETAKEPKDSEIIAEYKDRLLRAQAEFENFRKRSEKEKSDMFFRGVISTIEKILPVVDNFERGLDTADDSPFAEGIKMIYKQLMTTLNDMGVKEIEAEGQPFDPNLHNAVMHEDDPERGEQEVSQVLQKGYTYNDLVVRHAMVKVAN